MPTNKPRYTVSVDDDLFKKIEDFRYDNRYQTRSEATVELIRLGLETLKKENSKKKKNQLTLS
jgi:metal-responsive CopG/Arc/MetJ family transcriptional regulator